MTVYFISGLGVDKRVFARLQLPADLLIKHLEWIEPLYHESLSQYALRLSEGIDTSKPFIIVGLSFGGMIATEIAKVHRPVHVILLSSMATLDGLPNHYRLLGYLKIHRLIPSQWLKKTNPFVYWLFGIKSNEEKALFKSILNDTDHSFLRWAIQSILSWKNQIRPASIYQVHGAKDKVIPFQNVYADAVIEGAGHFMVFSHARQVTIIIKDKLGYS